MNAHTQKSDEENTLYRFKITPINTVEELKSALQNAMMVELTTLPLYLTAYFSFKPQIRQQTAHNARNLLKTIITNEIKHILIINNILVSIFGNNDSSIGCDYNIDFSQNINSLFPFGIRANISKIDEQSLTLLNLCSKEQIYHILMRMEEPNGDRQLLLSRKHEKNLNIFIPSNYNRNDSVKVQFEQNTNEITINDFYNYILDGLKLLSKSNEIQFHKNSDAKNNTTTNSNNINNNDDDNNNNYKQCRIDSFGLESIDELIDAINGIEIIINSRDSTDDGIYTRQEDLSHFVRLLQLLVGRDVVSIKRETDNANTRILNYTIKYGKEIKYAFDSNDLYPATNFKMEANTNTFDRHYQFLLKNWTNQLRKGTMTMKKATQEILKLESHFQACMRSQRFPLWKTNLTNL